MGRQSIKTTEEWEALEAGIRQLRQLLSRPFEDTKHHSKTAQDLLSSIEEVLQEPGRITFKVVGESRSGRSATSNSLFDVGGIARCGAAAAAAATTLTSQLFSGKKLDQVAPFLAKVSFFSRNDRWDILAGFIRDWHRRDKVRKSQIVDALQGLFNDWPACEDTAAVRSLLAETESEADVSIVAELMQYGDALMEGKETVELTASTPAELLSKLEPYDSEPRPGDGGIGFWPFVTLVRIYFDSALTRDGISFLETPGRIISNHVRSLNASRSSQEATHAIITTGARRVLANLNVRAEVHAAGDDRAVVVVTKSDDIDEYTMYEPGCELRRTWNELSLELEGVEAEIAKREQQTDATGGGVLDRRRGELEGLVRAAGNEEKSHRVYLHGRRMTSLLRYDLSTTPVLEVSNSEYAKHVAGWSRESPDGPFLSLEDTEIPELRGQITAMANRFRAKEMDRLIEVAVPALLDRVESFASDVASHETGSEDAEMELRRELLRVLPTAREIESAWWEDPLSESWLIWVAAGLVGLLRSSCCRIHVPIGRLCVSTGWLQVHQPNSK